MKFSQYLIEAATKAPKPPKRPNKDLLFRDKSLWTQDLQTHWGNFKIFKDEYDNEYAMDQLKKSVFGIWYAKDNDGIVFVHATIPTPGVDLS
jgi:hypothetical protein